ncbi:MAG: hypothetical protein GY816_18825 [Cytophagales bacterium]|nr:hypothetical protein [Cytophagales bacterium]
MKTLLFCSAIILTQLGFAQVKMEKDFQESFDVTTENKIEISNKYGEVIIRVWDESTVKITALVIAQGRSQDAVNKTMDRVDVSMRKIGQLVTADTNIERGGGSFKEIIGGVEDYSKALFGSQKLTVNYAIWMPKNIDLSINNKYGDVYMASLSGDVEVTLAHGDLKANGIEDHLDLEHSFGKSSFDYVHRGRFTMRGADIQIDEGGSLSFRSSSSDINLVNTHYVKLDSRNDKIIATDINELVGVGRFTDLQAERVIKNVNLKFSFGEISLSQINPKFKAISLTGTSTDINLVLNQASYIQASIKGDEDKMIVPNSMMSLSRDFDEEEGIVTLTGMVGYSNEFESQLTLDAEKGDVIISIKETAVFTDRR